MFVGGMKSKNIDLLSSAPKTTANVNRCLLKVPDMSPSNSKTSRCQDRKIINRRDPPRRRTQRLTRERNDN